MKKTTLSTFFVLGLGFLFLPTSRADFSCQNQETQIKSLARDIEYSISKATECYSQIETLKGVQVRLEEQGRKTRLIITAAITLPLYWYSGGFFSHAFFHDFPSFWGYVILPLLPGLLIGDLTTKVPKKGPLEEDIADFNLLENLEEKITKFQDFKQFLQLNIDEVINPKIETSRQSVENAWTLSKLNRADNYIKVALQQTKLKRELYMTEALIFSSFYFIWTTSRPASITKCDFL